MKMKEKYDSLKKRKIYVVSIVMLLSSIAILSYSLISKYVTEFKDTTATQSKNMVFASDYLKSTLDIPTYNIYGDSISFKLSNYEDENIEINDDDIEYSISTTCGNLSKNNGTLVGNEKNIETITLSNNNLESCTVTVKSLKPYSKELKATFNFKGIDEMIGYKIVDKGYYIILNILIGNSLDDITIDYTGFLPDTTNDLISSWTSGSKGTISATKLGKNSSYEIKFKKTTSSGTYNTKDIKSYSNIIDLDA